MACLKPADAESVKGMGGQQQQQQQKSIIEIYTDWANHYLDKTKGKRRIHDLQGEVSDGVILCEVVEAVTQQKVPDVNRKPKTSAQMMTNVQACLNFLLAKGVAVEDVRPEDIREGNLKAILGLFFQLSRYKQQQKQLNGRQSGGGSVPPSPKHTTSIPMPSSVMSPKREAKRPEDIRAAGGGGASRIACPNSRPPCSNGLANGQQRASAGGRQMKVMQSQGVQSSPQHSMLDRFRPGKVSSIPQSPVKRGLGKRTSSSSGFSSARSDRSESSLSLSSDTNFPSPSALRRIQEATGTSGSADSPSQQQPSPSGSASDLQQQQQQHSPRTARSSGLRSKFAVSRAGKDKAASPKRSPKLGPRGGGVTEIKDYGPIDERQQEGRPVNYPPHAYSRNGLRHTNVRMAVAETVVVSSSVSSSGGGGSRIPNPGAAGRSKIGGSGIPSPRTKPPPPVRTTPEKQPSGTARGSAEVAENGRLVNGEGKVGEYIYDICYPR